MRDKAVFMTAIFGLGFLFGLDVSDASAKRETDEQKWERLEKHREIRRGIEVKYEACMASCSNKCNRRN